MKIILLRHAKSDWSTPGQPDHDRPLNARGRAAAARMGDWLRSRGHVPDLVLCSDAARTRETLKGLGLPETRTEHRADLYQADAEAILAAVAAADATCVLVVGHNPGLAEAARRACATPPAHPDFARYPTGACTVIDGPLPGRCLDFATPRDP